MANRLLSSYNKARSLLFIAALVCFLLFWFAAGLLGVPRYPGYEASLLLFNPLSGMLLVLVGMVIAALIGSLIAGTIRFDAGIVAATLGVMAISVRGGRMESILLGADGPRVYIVMMVETLVLFGFIATAWAVLWGLLRAGMLQDDAARDGVRNVDDSMNQQLLAMVAQAIILALLLLLLCRTDQKPQVIAALGISSFLATIAAYQLFPVRPSVWYWCGPLLVAMIGYGLAYLDPIGWEMGKAGNTFGALARPLPLDYAGVAPAGAIVGYWMGRRWQRTQESSKAAAPATNAAGA